MPVPRSLGKFTLLKKLATGGMGEVWLARAQPGGGFPERVVVKRLLEHLQEEQEFINMFFDEARIASALVHPNIARIYDLGEADGEYFIAMEWVHGVPLGEVLVRAVEKAEGIPPALTCRIVADAAHALDHAHTAKGPTGAPLGLIHRDVSPQNILVGFDGVSRLIDFGIAKAANKLVRTATGIIRGKYAYMSPEQAYDEVLDGRSDVFSLGIVLWENLCAQRLFKRETEADTLQAVVEGKIASPSRLARRLPKRLDELVMKALERDVDARLASAAAFAVGLEGIIRRQRLPATHTHVATWLKELFPEQAYAPDPFDPEDTDPSSELDTRPRRKGRTLETKVLDPRELEARIQATGPRDTVRGVFFNALIVAVVRAVGGQAEPHVRRAAVDPRAWVDALDYPTSEYLRMLWKAVELLAPKLSTVAAAFEQLGRFSMDALLRSPVGAPLLATRGDGPVACLTALLPVLDEQLKPGQRTVQSASAQQAVLLIKEDVLPIQVLTGLLASALGTLHGVVPQATWEKPAAQRVEVTVRWG